MSRSNTPYRDQSRSSGLPSDEYRTLRRAQDRSRLESHFSLGEKVDATYTTTSSAYRSAGLSQSERFRVSEVRSATRSALGSSFNFDDESYERSMRREGEYQQSRGWISEDETRHDPIPKKYLDEFNRKWHEDDEDNDADQYLADCASEAKWRRHVLPEESRFVEPLHTGRPASSRADSGYAGSEFMRPRTPPIVPLPRSKFSCGVSEVEPWRHRYLDRLRRH
jgi:hypothetical protein